MTHPADNPIIGDTQRQSSSFNTTNLVKCTVTIALVTIATTFFSSLYLTTVSFISGCAITIGTVAIVHYWDIDLLLIPIKIIEFIATSIFQQNKPTHKKSRAPAANGPRPASRAKRSNVADRQGHNDGRQGHGAGSAGVSQGHASNACARSNTNCQLSCCTNENIDFTLASKPSRQKPGP